VNRAIAILSVITLAVLGGAVALVLVALFVSIRVSDYALLLGLIAAILSPFFATAAGALAAFDALRTKRWGWLAGLVPVILVGLIVPYVLGRLPVGELAGVLLVLAPFSLPPVAGLLYLLLTRPAEPTQA
jgi:hypothetical protein